MKKKPFKAHRNRKSRISPDIMARDFLGMADEEIRVARAEEAIGTQHDNIYARNKALQSAGMGIELVYKALILAQGVKSDGKVSKGHRIKVLHAQLVGTDKDELEKCICNLGWPDPSEWCRYLDDTVNHTQRKYFMYDTQRQRQGISFPTWGPASVAGIVQVFERAFELADRRVQFSTRKRHPSPSQALHLPDNGEIRRRLIAEINLPEGQVRSGEPLGGMSQRLDTGDVRILSPDEMEAEPDAEPGSTRDPP